MILKRTCILLLAGLFLISNSNSCKQRNKNANKNGIKNFIKITKNEPIEIYKDWNVWKRNDGFVFDYKDEKHRLLIINDSKGKALFKEIFPKQDSAFYPLIELERRYDQYPFKVNDFIDKVFLFQKLKVDRVNSIIEDSLIMFVNENYTIIFSEKETDIRGLNRYKEYSKHDNHWYYYMKK